MPKLTAPALMSLNAGYVDTAGFLALHGLFTAHVTGNFVTFGAAMALGTSGAAAKLLALPMFCLVVIVTRIASFSLPRGLPVLRTMLTLKIALLALGAALAVWLAPFTPDREWAEVATGMVLVSAMAIQNAAHRIHLSSAPPTTLMTGTTTQIMIDIADCIRGIPSDKKDAIKVRLKQMSLSVTCFAIGCGLGALFFALFKEWCFTAAPLMALPPLFMAGTKDKP